MYKKFGCQYFHVTLKYTSVLNDKYSQIVVYDDKCIVKVFMQVFSYCDFNLVNRAT